MVMRSTVRTGPVVVRAGAISPLVWGEVSQRRIESMSRVTGTLYLARCERFHKLGFTQLNAKKRVTGLQNSNPFPVTLVHQWPGSRWDEWAWHQRLWRYRVRGEWFELPDEVLEELMGCG